MPIEMPRGLPFSVDTWTSNSRKKRHHFLTHAHKDHSQGILGHASYPIYATALTKTLVLQYYPQLDSNFFVGIEIGQSLVIDDLDGEFMVTAFDANHCPGAVMFLFEGRFGNILHTGDCRLIPELLQCLPQKYLAGKEKEHCPLDYVFLDCTFGRAPFKMPCKQLAIQQVINCIWKHPDAPTVYLSCDLLGQEEILVNVSETFGCKIYIDKEKNPERYQALELIVPEILSQDSCVRIHIFEGFPRLYERAEAKIAEAHANYQHEPLIIRPSAQWYVCEEESLKSENKRNGRCEEAVRDSFGVWHVCYSIHSSRVELEWALQLLAPKWVVSTTPSCRAMELDFVKKHCFNTQRSGDSLWRLLDICIQTPASDTPDTSSSCSSILERKAKPICDTESQLQRALVLTTCRGQFDLSPPGKRPPITLFGSARHGSKDSIFMHVKEGALQHNDSSNTQTENVSPKKQIEGTSKCGSLLMSEKREVEEETKSYRTKEDTSFQNDEVENEKSFEKKKNKASEEKLATKRKYASVPPFGSSKSFSENLRGFYRSMNVPVPQPLPSLMELMNENEYSKRKI